MSVYINLPLAVRLGLKDYHIISLRTNTQKQLRANSDRSYYRKFLLLGIAALGFAIWSLVDGAITYPNQRVRALEYLRLEEENRLAEWEDIASKNGWSTENPGEPKTKGDIDTQYIMAVFSVIVGVCFLIKVWRSRGSWIEGSETGLDSSWGQSLEYNQVVKIDKKKWRNKGIAKIKYKQGKRNKKFVIDDFKFERYVTGRILFELESKSGTDKIVGGKPETLSQEASNRTSGKTQ